MADDECTCQNGQRMVTDVWARQEAGIHPQADVAALEQQARRIADLRGEANAHLGETDGNGQARYPMPDDTALALIEQMAKYRAALNTVFPCPTCRPKQFARWRHGCWRPNHVASRCRLCKDDK